MRALALGRRTYALAVSFLALLALTLALTSVSIPDPARAELVRDGKSVWVADRCGGSCAGSNLDPILKFDDSGKLLKSFGAGMFVSPHGIHVDRQGNVWVADGQGKGAKGHQVFKFSPDGKVLMTLGKMGVGGGIPFRE